jgi:hypothetical protein
MVACGCREDVMIRFDDRESVFRYQDLAMMEGEEEEEVTAPMGL